MKDVILTKSLQLFITKGFKTVTMDDIAKELSISKKTIYSYYNSKESLVKASVEFVLDKTSLKLKELAGNCETPIHEHFEMKNWGAEIFGRDIQASAIYQFQKYYPKIAEEVNIRRKKDLDNIVIRNLKEGIDKELYRKDIDIEFIANIYFSTTHSFYNNEYIVDMYKKEDVKDINFKFIEYHLRGIVTPKGLEILEKLLNPNIKNEI